MHWNIELYSCWIKLQRPLCMRMVAQFWTAIWASVVSLFTYSNFRFLFPGQMASQRQCKILWAEGFPQICRTEAEDSVRTLTRSSRVLGGSIWQGITDGWMRRKSGEAFRWMLRVMSWAGRGHFHHWCFILWLSWTCQLLSGAHGAVEVGNSVAKWGKESPLDNGWGSDLVGTPAFWNIIVAELDRGTAN